MKKKLLILSLLFACVLPFRGHSLEISKELLTYDVTYKWGLIHKKAGSVSLTTVPHATDKEFNALLVASTAPWADKFFMLRDTLKGTIDSRSFIPRYYERIAHEGGSYARDILHYTRSGQKVSAKAALWRKNKKDTEIKQSERLHEAEGLTLDMLSSFYFMRQIDFASMKKGDAVRMNIFSGKKKEYLTIHFKGIENVKIGKTQCQSYHITFTFTTEGGKVSSDNMDAWISTDPSRIPLLMEGKLPVGKVRAIYSGALPS